MNKIHIAHNPFTVHTEFLINDMQPAEGCKLISYRESRLQQWVENLFVELRALFNGEEDYDITFRGVESDFLDLEEAALKAQAAGAKVQLHWEKVAPAEHRLEQIRTLWDEVAQHPQISAHVQSNREAREEVEAAFDRNFDVYVVATMSSGKSTLINAMLGTSLLPAANEATTATIARIADSKQMLDRFSAQRIGREGELLDEIDTSPPMCLHSGIVLQILSASTWKATSRRSANATMYGWCSLTRLAPTTAKILSTARPP
jgi:hypothetical protein